MSRALRLIRENLVAAFTQNLSLKFLAFLATMVIFLMVRGTEEAQRSVMVDVVALLPPRSSGRIIVSDVPEDVRITVRGAASIIEGLRRDDIPPVQVDLRGPPVHTFYFDESMFILPGGVRIVSVAESDASFAVEWDRFVRRRVPVRIDAVGRPAPGTTAKRPLQVTPAEIAVSGAENRVNEISELEAEPVNVAGLPLGRHERTVPLGRPPPHTELDHEGPVRVTVEIIPDLVDRLYSGVPITVIGGEHRFEVRPGRIDVRVRGPREVVSALSAERIVPFMDGTTITEEPGETVRLSPTLEDLPPQVELVEMIPAHVFVEVRRGPAKRQ